MFGLSVGKTYSFAIFGFCVGFSELQMCMALSLGFNKFNFHLTFENRFVSFANKKILMKLFFKYIGEHLRLYPQVRFTKNDEILIRNSAMNHLGLTNLNQMRDRYEGQAFFEKTSENIEKVINGGAQILV